MNNSTEVPRIVPSDMDNNFLASLRQNIVKFLTEASALYATPDSLILDVAPQDNGGATPFFSFGTRIETLDISPDAGCTYVADLCRTNSDIPDDHFDIVVCTEVLEHTVQPFDAVRELHRILKPQGVLLLSTPYNFRIHGPLPDCWRFTEHGLRVLLDRFEILTLTPLEAPDRPLMPIQYTVAARKRLLNNSPEIP
jgi:SAM-dependent methyltransferase